MSDHIKIAAEVDHEQALKIATRIWNTVWTNGTRVVAEDILARAYISQHAKLVLLREALETYAQFSDKGEMAFVSGALARAALESP